MHAPALVAAPVQRGRRSNCRGSAHSLAQRHQSSHEPAVLFAPCLCGSIGEPPRKVQASALSRRVCVGRGVDSSRAVSAGVHRRSAPGDEGSGVGACCGHRSNRRKSRQPSTVPQVSNLEQPREARSRMTRVVRRPGRTRRRPPPPSKPPRAKICLIVRSWLHVGQR